MRYVCNLFIHTWAAEESRAKMASRKEPKKELGLHRGSLHFYPGSDQPDGRHCHRHEYILAPGAPATCLLPWLRRHRAESCAGDPVFGLSGARRSLSLQSGIKINKMSSWKLNLKNSTNWIRRERWEITYIIMKLEVTNYQATSPCQTPRTFTPYISLHLHNAPKVAYYYWKEK